MFDIYLLTEECPKKSSICLIINQLLKDFFNVQMKFNIPVESCTIEPNYFNNFENKKVLLRNYSFRTPYLSHIGIKRVYIIGVSGYSSFCDYMVFVKEIKDNEILSRFPNQNDEPLMIIEETKTSDKESRNTGVYQRAIKFTYAQHFYPKSKLYMLYNNDYNPDHDNPSDTNVFGTNVLLTLGVSIIGKETYMHYYNKFNSVQELINAKNQMILPRNGQPIRIDYSDNSCIKISCRLIKNDKIAHDPNIGTVSCIAAGLRKLGYSGNIVITNHQLNQNILNSSHGNKLLFICSILKMSLDGLSMPTINIPASYWHDENESEKIASIYLQILSDKYGLKTVYQNHAGCERSYFISKNNEAITVPKKIEGIKISIPDLVILCPNENNFYYYTLIEGKKLSTLYNGLNEVDEYSIFENLFLKDKNLGFPDFPIYRALTIFGGELDELPDDRVLLYINKYGKIFTNPNAPFPWNVIFQKEGLC